MKHAIALAGLMFSLMLPGQLNAQGEVAVGGEAGFTLLGRKNANFAFPIGFNVERGMQKNLSIYGRFAYEVGLGRGDFNTFYITPEVRYNFHHVLDGPYVGGFIGFGPSSASGFYMAVGAVGGYKFPISEHFNIDASVQVGMGNGGNALGRVTGLHFRPTAGLRYAF